MRVKVDWRSASKEVYEDFCAKHPEIKLSYKKWSEIVYEINHSFRDYALETGDKVSLPFGFGFIYVNKKIRKKKKKLRDGREIINLPIDWKKTREAGKYIYNFNYHTDGYYFGWIWNSHKSLVKHAGFFRFKASRVTSRKLAEYINKPNSDYQNIYKQWIA